MKKQILIRVDVSTLKTLDKIKKELKLDSRNALINLVLSVFVNEYKQRLKENLLLFKEGVEIEKINKN